MGYFTLCWDVSPFIVATISIYVILFIRWYTRGFRMLDHKNNANGFSNCVTGEWMLSITLKYV